MCRLTITSCAACWLLCAAAFGEDAAPKQNYGEWKKMDGGITACEYEAEAAPGGAKGTVKLQCIFSPADANYAYYIDAITNKCLCRYDFERAAFETVPAEEQTTLKKTTAAMFKRIQGAPIVPGSNQVALAAPKKPVAN